MATETRAAVHLIEHDNHAPPSTLTARQFSSQLVNSIVLSNVSESTTMSISFDGVNLFTILPGGSFSTDFANQKQYWTKGDTVGIMQVLIGSEGKW